MPDSGPQDPFGSWLDRELVNLALSVNNAALFSYRFADQAVTWVSDGMEALLDQTGAPDWQVRARLGAFVDPLVRAAAHTPLWQDLELQQPLSAADRQQRWIGVRARRVGTNGTEGLVGIVTDASAEQQSLTELANRYRLLVELSPQAIAVHQDEVVTYVNPATLAFFGAESESELVGHRLTELVDEDSIVAMRQRLASLTSTGDVTAARQAYLDRFDGGVVPVEVVSVRTSWRGRPAYQVIMWDLTEQHRQNQLLRYQARHDELTGLLNRTGINELLAELRPGGDRQAGLVFCDIDHFKRINDSLGHEAGDEVLSALAQRLSARLPEHCAAGRLSGDEFVLVCWDLAAVGGLQALMRQVSELLRTTVAVAGQLVHVSASTGAAVFTDSMAGHDLLRYADAAMFHAKGTGGGRALLADPDMVTSSEGQLVLEEQLREALSHDQLQLHYQPITNRKGTVVMAEALLRWPHPERGLLSPGVILPVAGQAGLLAELDQWVLRTALEQATSWPDHDDGAVSVAVNLGVLTPDEPDFTDTILSVISNSGLDPSRVVLEMVETTLVDLTETSRQAMRHLSQHGVRFALDDFGTGYSSLARLKDLPTHILKLDRQFVTDLDHDPRDHAIAHTVVTLAHALGHHCLAEGIETPRQLELVTELGTDLHQGFLLSHPLPPNELHTRLATHTHITPGEHPWDDEASSSQRQAPRRHDQ